LFHVSRQHSLSNSVLQANPNEDTGDLVVLKIVNTGEGIKKEPLRASSSKHFSRRLRDYNFWNEKGDIFLTFLEAYWEVNTTFMSLEQQPLLCEIFIASCSAQQ